MKKLLLLLSCVVLMGLVSCGKAQVQEDISAESQDGLSTDVSESHSPTLQANGYFVIQDDMLYFKKKTVEYAYLPSDGNPTSLKQEGGEILPVYQGNSIVGSDGTTLYAYPRSIDIPLQYIPSDLTTFKEVSAVNTETEALQKEKTSIYSNTAGEVLMQTESGTGSVIPEGYSPGDGTGRTGIEKSKIAEDAGYSYLLVESKYACMGQVDGCTGEVELEIVKK